MAKPRGKNAAASASKPEKDEETNNAPLTETEPEKTEVLAVATGAGEKVDKENEDQEATDGDNTEQNMNEEEMEENENEEVLEDNKDGEKMEETTNKEKLEEKKNEDKTEGTNGDQVENTPGKKGRRPRNRKNKKGNQGAADAKPAEKSDKPESSSKETDGKKAESRGMIFLCSSKTKKDCYQYKLFGLPASKKDQVEKIYKGMRLFLFDLDKKLMYGIYKAAAPGGYNLEPKAFKAAFPAQVRFSIMEDCKPLHEEKFKAAIKKNYYGKNKFNTELDAEQVWRVADSPENDKFQYTYFAHKINSFESAPKNLLSSDSRLRPDRYALEKGDLSKAGSEKTRGYNRRCSSSMQS